MIRPADPRGVPRSLEWMASIASDLEALAGRDRRKVVGFQVWCPLHGGHVSIDACVDCPHHEPAYDSVNLNTGQGVIGCRERAAAKVSAEAMLTTAADTKEVEALNQAPPDEAAEIAAKHGLTKEEVVAMLRRQHSVEARRKIEREVAGAPAGYLPLDAQVDKSAEPDPEIMEATERRVLAAARREIEQLRRDLEAELAESIAADADPAAKRLPGKTVYRPLGWQQMIHSDNSEDG